MCTVSFLPLQNDGFILTHNRDEKTLREPALLPSWNKDILYPKDGRAGGTWIACSKNNRTVCLLNGAFEKHVSQPPYRISRGKVVLDAFEEKSFEDFVANYNLEGIEPFTLIVVDHAAQIDLYELRWDGVTKHFKLLDPSNVHFWCSATLYPKEVAQTRRTWFDEWVKNNVFEEANIRHFHQYGGTGDPENDLMINRDDFMKTISITSILKNEGVTSMNYLDLLNNEPSNI